MSWHLKRFPLWWVIWGENGSSICMGLLAVSRGSSASETLTIGHRHVTLFRLEVWMLTFRRPLGDPAFGLI